MDGMKPAGVVLTEDLPREKLVAALMMDTEARVQLVGYHLKEAAQHINVRIVEEDRLSITGVMEILHEEQQKALAQIGFHMIKIASEATGVTVDELAKALSDKEG